MHNALYTFNIGIQNIPGGVKHYTPAYITHCSIRNIAGNVKHHTLCNTGEKIV